MTTVPESVESPTSVNQTRPSDAGLSSQAVRGTAKPPGEPSDRTIEATALAGSAAIRRIIAERNELRRERERLLGINEELRRRSDVVTECSELRRERERLLGLNEQLRKQNERMSELQDRYGQLATELIVELRQMGLTIQEVSRKMHDLSANTKKEKDPELEQFARRFAATNKAG